MGSARAIGGCCNPALAPMLFSGAPSIHGTKAARYVHATRRYSHIAGEHHGLASYTAFETPEELMPAVASDRAGWQRVGSTSELSGQVGTDYLGCCPRGRDRHQPSDHRRGSEQEMGSAGRDR